MDKSNKLKLKDAKRLYQSGDYQASHEIIQEVLGSDPTNYNAIVLDGACSDHMGMEEAGMDLFHQATQLEPDNPIAWRGLFQLGRKNMDRYYESLVCVCLKLLHFHFDHQDAEKRVQYARTLIELLIRYRLELPEGMTNLRNLCHLVLKSIPSDVFALEMVILLKIEAFFIIGLPSLIAPTLHDSPDQKDRLLTVSDDLLSDETQDQLASLENECKIKSEWHSQTMESTAQLGKLVLSAARLLKFGPNHTPTYGWEDILNELATLKFGGCTGFSTWFQRGYLPLHVICLYALASFKVHKFTQCETLLYHASSFCLDHKSSAQDESHRLLLLSSYPPSQCKSFLTPRPLCTQFRSLPATVNLFTSDEGHLNVSPYDLLGEWILALRLANASASELSEYATRLCTQQSHHQQCSFVWSSVIRTLWIECYLSINRLDMALSVICPSDLDALSLGKVANVALTSDPSEIRFRICTIQTAVEFVIHTGGPDKHTQTTLETLSTMAMDLTPRLKSLCSARDHFLLAHLFDRFALATSVLRKDILQAMQLEQCLAGIQADDTYYANHLLAGQQLRATGSINDALSALHRAHELVPNSPEAAYQLALTLCQQNKLEKALEAYSTVDKKLFTKHMWLNFGLITLRLNKPSLCVPAFGNVVVADPKNALYWEILGEAYLLRRSYETAVKTFSRAIQLDPSRPIAHTLCGLCYRHLGEFNLAKTYFTSGLSHAREKFEKNPANLNLLIFALKGLVEFSILMENSYLREGSSVRSIDEFETALFYLDEVFRACSNTGRTPIWAYHYTAIAFSLLCEIDVTHLRCKLPDRFRSILRELDSCLNSAPVGDNEMQLNTGLLLAGIYFAVTLKFMDSFVYLPKSHVEVSRSESPLIVHCCLSVSFGLHCLSHSLRLPRLVHGDNGQSSLLDARRLLQFAESALKRAIDLLTNDAARDQQYLDQNETEEDICEVNKIAQIESNEQQVVRDRLAINKNLRSKAWYGLAVLYSTMNSADYGEHVDYCLCQALVAYPKNTSAGISLALRLWHQGRTQFATSLLSHFQGSDPTNSLVWLASAHIHAITDAPETRPPQMIDQFDEVTHAALRDLLHAACFQTNTQVTLHLLSQLFPVLIEAVGLLNDAQSRKHLCTVKSQKMVSFLRLAIEVSTESVNRCLAYQPRNPVLWHSRGILLQLSGLSTPATYCLKKTVKLLSESCETNEESRPHLQLAVAQLFLLTFIRGNPNWTLADQLISFSGQFNSTACASLAEAFAKGLIFLHHPTKPIRSDFAAICFVDEPSRLIQQDISPALVAAKAWPNFGEWILLLSSLRNGQTSMDTLADFSALTPIPPNRPHLLRALCNLVVKYEKTLSPNSQFLANLCALNRKQLVSLEHNSACAGHPFSGHLLCENACMNPQEYALWALDTAALYSTVSGSPFRGLAWLSRFVIYRPNDASRWTAVAAWLLKHHLISSSRPSVCDKQDNSGCWRAFIHAISVILRLRSDAPIDHLFAHTLSDCAVHWLSTGLPSCVSEKETFVILSALRHSAALFPQIPRLLTNLKLFCSLYTPSV